LTGEVRPPAAAVIGSPIAHSLSPAIHRFWLDEAGADGVYAPILVADDDGAFHDALAALRTLGFRGLNVTSPHKDRALAFADEASDAARTVGAANMLTFTDRGVAADNSDVAGVREPVARVFGERATIRTLVLGGGGAARAAATALAVAGPLTVSNRTREKAETIACASGADAADWRDWRARSFDLVVNATTLGRAATALPAEAAAALADDGAAFDMIYRPLATPFLLAARERGLRTIDGLEMLIAQAKAGARRWFGVEPADDARTRAVLLEHMKARG